MRMENDFPELLAPYKSLENDKRYTLVEGGRGSAKSFHVCVFLLCLTYRPEEVILFTRYTMSSASISIIPEFKEKIDEYNLEEAFEVTNTSIINRYTGSRIIFSGIKTGSGNQTAKLKSISGLTCWILDEAEEMVSKEEFDKIDDSIRKLGGSNRVILVLNPAYKSHWIFKHFHANGKREDTCYIKTTYQDNRHNLAKSFIDKINALRATDYEEYAHRYGGEWKALRKGIIFPDFDAADDFPDHAPIIYGLDFGWTDPMAMVAVAIMDPFIYVKEVIYQSHLTTPDLIKRLPELGIKGNDDIYYDSAEPGSGQQLFTSGFRSAKPCIKGSDSIRAGISKIKRYKIVVISGSDNLIDELLNYAWAEDRDGNTIDGKPEDENNHLIDALRYAVYTHTFKPTRKAKKVVAGKHRKINPMRK